MALDTTERGLRIVAPDNDTVLDLELLQGLWTEEQYFKLTDYSRRLLEFTDGTIEVLPMPTDRHQVISRFLLFALFAMVQPLGGTVLYAPLRLQIREGRFREPDLLLVRDANDPRRQNRFWLGADLVVEIVSPDDPERDLIVKRGEYAEAGIPEYWIVNPMDETMTVLTLAGDTYREHGVFRRGDQARSILLDGFEVSVAEVFDAE
ncbi:MAG: Uma2 family endonuclease [Candidatus Tectomicrobia bacterium]|nr:Uma2 family endonuclease [Candidatus Tectomicrobia bacterium]